MGINLNVGSGKVNGITYSKDKILSDKLSNVTEKLENMESSILPNKVKINANLVKKVENLVPFSDFDVSNVDLSSYSNTFKVEYPHRLYKIDCLVNGSSKEYYAISDENGIIDTHSFLSELKNTNVVITGYDKVGMTEVINQISIFDLPASRDIFKDNKFGSNQSDVRIILEKYYNGETLEGIDIYKARLLDKVIEKYYPDLGETAKYLIAQKYSATGCAYLGIAEALAVYFGSIENGENIFRYKFGYDLTINGQNGQRDFQIEALALDMFLDYNSKRFGDVYTLVSNNSKTKVSVTKLENIFSDYFKERGITFDVNTLSVDINSEVDQKVTTFLLNHDDGFNFIHSGNFDLHFISGERTEAIGKFSRNIGGHAMMVTGVDIQANPIVSTWGMEANFSLKDLIKNSEANDTTWLYVQNIKFDFEN